jgi:hypothetical protein
MNLVHDTAYPTRPAEISEAELEAIVTPSSAEVRYKAAASCLRGPPSVDPPFTGEQCQHALTAHRATTRQARAVDQGLMERSMTRSRS